MPDREEANIILQLAFSGVSGNLDLNHFYCVYLILRQDIYWI